MEYFDQLVCHELDSIESLGEDKWGLKCVCGKYVLADPNILRLLALKAKQHAR